MKRAYMCLTAVAVAAIAAVVVTGSVSAQAPAGAAPTPPPSRGTAVFNVARVMKDYIKWQYFAASMNKERAGKAGEMAQLRNQMLDVENKIRIEQIATTKVTLEQQLVALTRTFEDKERVIRKDIDEKSAVHLKTLFGEIRTVVDAVAKTNGFELVLAYPDALTAEEMNSPLYFDLKMRPPAAMPFYVSPSIDITMVVVQTLNKNFPAPGPVDPPPGVTPTAGTAPAGTPPAGQPMR